MDIREILSKTLGKCGRLQWMIVILVYISKIPVAFHLLLMVVQHAEPDFVCKDPPGVDKCSSECVKREFDTSTWEKTIVTDFDLVCNLSWVPHTIQTIIMLGILIGNVLFGWISDKWGRKWPLIIAILIQTISGTLAGLIPNIIMFTLLRFISTMTTGGMMLTSFVIMMEYTTDFNIRTIVGIMFQLPFHVGHGLLGPIAYLTPRWDYIQIICSAPFIILMVYICLIPESPRWLATMRKTDKLVKTLEWGAKWNRMPTEEIRSDIQTFMVKMESVPLRNPGNCLDLCSTKRMGIKSIVLFLNWFIISCTFYGVAQFMGVIQGNVFVNIAFSGFAQVPGNLLAIPLCRHKKIGRKYAMVISYLLTSVPLFIFIFVPKDVYWALTLLGSLSMCGCGMQFSIIYVYSSELYPTIVRNIGMGISSMIARVGSMISPFIVYSKLIAFWVPVIIFSFLPVIGILTIVICLPETNLIPMPDTIEQADQL